MISLPEDIVCGYFDCHEWGDMPLSPKRTVTKYEIEFYTRDAGVAMSDEDSFEIKKGYIQIARPGEVRHSALPFFTMFLKFSASGELETMLKRAPKYFKCSSPEAAGALFEELIQLSEDSDSELLFYSKLLSLLDLILSDARSTDRLSPESREAVLRSKKFIEEHFSEPIKLDDIAAAARLSSIYFHNLFLSEVGVTPHSYLIGCRISAAKRMLRSSENGMSDIAEACGLGCQQYFTKIFKKETGITPAKYRRDFRRKYFS